AAMASMKAEPGAGEKDKKTEQGDKKGPAAKTAKKAGKKPDPAVVSAGTAAFERSCTTCHNAARALDRTKDLAGWGATVKRMAAAATICKIRAAGRWPGWGPAGKARSLARASPSASPVTACRRQDSLAVWRWSKQRCEWICRPLSSRVCTVGRPASTRGAWW